MSPTRDRPADPDTRLRLLQAAGRVFAEQGFRDATVREICAGAGANVAAVSYHFGGKEELYGALLEHLGRLAIERHPPDRGVAPGATAEERLFAFVHSFLTRMLEDEGVGSIVAREMVEPTPALDRLVDEVVRPLFGRLRGIVGELLGPEAGEDEIVLSARSVVGQCLFYRHARPVWQRLQPKERLTPERLVSIAEHITRFSLGGLRRNQAMGPRRKRTETGPKAASAAARRSAARVKRSEPGSSGTATNAARGPNEGAFSVPARRTRRSR